MQTKYLTISEVAERTRHSANTIRNWVRGYYTKNGKAIKCQTTFVPAHRSGKKLLFKESEVERWIEEQQVAA